MKIEEFDEDERKSEEDRKARIERMKSPDPRLPSIYLMNPRDVNDVVRGDEYRASLPARLPLGPSLPFNPPTLAQRWMGGCRVPRMSDRLPLVSAHIAHMGGVED